MRSKEDNKLGAMLDAIKLLDIVVVYPKFLKGMTNVLEPLKTLDVVSSNRKHFDSSQFGEADQTFYFVGG